MEIIYNKEGTPLLMQSSYLYANTTSDRETMRDRRRVLFPYDDDHRDYTWVNGKRVVSWGIDNQFPYHAIRTVRDTTVLNTGLKFLWRLTLGQGIFPCTVEGFDDNGNEILIKDGPPLYGEGAARLSESGERCLSVRSEQ